MKDFQDSLTETLPIFENIDVALIFTAITHRNVKLCNSIINLIGTQEFINHVSYLNDQLGEKTFVITYEDGWVETISVPGRKEIPQAKEWIDEYRNLFPAGVFTGNRPVKGDKSGCIKKMDTFLKTHPNVDKETILNATKMYVDRARANGYDRMTCADYFIEKLGVSLLEGYIEQLKESGNKKPFSNITEL